MLAFLARRLAVLAATMVALSAIVFALVNLEPNLRKLALEQNNMRMDRAAVDSWLEREGYRPFHERYLEWLGGFVSGDLGHSTRFRQPVGEVLPKRLGYTGVLAFWVLATMVPAALLVGVLAGMREGSRADRVLSVFSIGTTATPEYVSGILFTVLFASILGLLKGVARAGDVTFENFALPVMTMSVYGMGYIARMTRASMAEVMTSQYIRTARLKGLSFRAVVLRHALRNALIAPFTVILLQFPWLLTGVVIVEKLFNYKGFGWLLVEAADNNDIALLLSCSMVSVLVVIGTQLVSDVGYAWLNPPDTGPVTGAAGILAGAAWQFWPVWLALAAVFLASRAGRARLGLYGRLFESGVGVAGLLIVLFWVLTALMADLVATFDPLQQFVQLKRKPPGTVEAASGVPFYFGGDNLGRDLFSRMVHGSRFVLLIAPAATLVAIMVGITLGLPAGYYGGRADGALSFLANLILAFPVIVLFYLLVTPGVRETAIPNVMAGVFFLFPIAFAAIVVWSRYRERPAVLPPALGAIAVVGGWLYMGFAFDLDPFGVIGIDPNELNIFAAVVFASAPGIFRIVRGLTMDIRTRDYVAAARTRGESPWYIMLWEILPNARGPLIVDACLRIGYTTILLGTLGFFGLGLAPESPDWGSMINQTRGFIRIAPTIVLPQTIALASLVLGLNLLADGLREQSLRD